MLKSQDLVLAFIWNTGVLGLICHCDYHCPDNHKNFTCETDYKCFTTMQFLEGGSTEKVSRHGCMPSEHEGGMFQCRHNNANAEVPISVLCCHDRDLCNQDLRPTLSPIEQSDYMNRITGKKKEVENDSHGIALVITITVCVMLLVIIVTYLYLKFQQITSKQKQHSAKKMLIVHGREPVNSISELFGRSSGTGVPVPEVPILTQRTIAREISLYHEIGTGMFGTVYKARWKQQYVAVKFFKIFAEASWQRELDMYQTPYLCHENILGFIAADVQEVGLNREVQRLLITAYHDYGSLYDFLHTHSFDYRILYRLIISAISGLSHIHCVINGAKGKPAIAHRDFNSKNILVKENLQCCIADLGLAIKMDSETNEIDFGHNTRLPNVRYMAPEILENPQNFNNYTFDIYQKADIYAFGLVLWEITQRYEVGNSPEEYQLPFTTYVSDNPTVVDMYDVVCRKQCKLTLPLRYEEDSHAKGLIKLMNECWHHSPSARLTALRLKKTLQKCVKTQEDLEDSSESSIGTASSGLS